MLLQQAPDRKPKCMVKKISLSSSTFRCREVCILGLTQAKLRNNTAASYAVAVVDNPRALSDLKVVVVSIAQQF